MKRGGRFLVMTAGEHLYAISLEQVASVLQTPSVIYPVPGVPLWCEGAIRSSGVVVAVIDLSMYVGAERSSLREKVVVLDLVSGGLGLLVDRVEDLMVGDSGNMEQDSRGSWLLTASGRAELLDAHELIDEVTAAMARI